MSEVKPTHIHAEPELAHVKPAKSKGEKLFDRVVYAGFAGVGAFVLTVPVTFLLKHHARVAPYFERGVDALHRLLVKVSPSVERKTADKILTTTALMQGGNLMLLPIGVAEKHKVPIVSGLNTMMGDTTPPEQIEKAPKQTWGSLIESRVLAWLAVFVAFKGAEKFVPTSLTTFENEVGERACQLMDKPKERMIKGKLVPSKTYLYGKIGALDFFATIAAATLLYVGGHFFARKREEKLERRSQHGGLAQGDGAVVESVDNAGAVMAGKADLPASQVVGEKAAQGTLAAAITQQADAPGLA